MEERVQLLEMEELASGPEGFPIEGYTELLAYYLLQNELTNAKFLWKRIPIVHKQNPELVEVWSLGQKLWIKDMPGFFTTIATFQWSQNILPIMEQLKVSTRENQIGLIGSAYTSVSPEDISSLTGCTKDEALDLVVNSKGWPLIDGFIEPKTESLPNNPIISSEQQISQLTDYVAFLEN